MGTITQKEIVGLQGLLQIEKQEEIARHESFLKDTSISGRVASGSCWFPLEIEKIGYGLGDYPYLIVNRSSSETKGNQFSVGKVVSLFGAQQGKETERCQGIVNAVEDHQLKITLYSDDPPEWLDEGKLGVDVMFDMNAYREMERALEIVLNAERNRIAELREIVLGQKKPEFANLTHPIQIPHLNASQNEALNQVLAAKDVSIIHGPPGTGKTTTLVEVIRQLVKNEKQVLVTAPSNAAADLLTEKALAANLKVIRIGNLARVNEALLANTVEGKLAEHPENNALKDLKKRANEFRRMAGKYKRNFGKEEREQRKLMYREARTLAKDAIRLENQIIDQMIRNADVVTCTLVGSSNRYLRDKSFETVIIDEAAQALEPSCWIPIIKAQKVIMAGDPFQLPPTVKSPEAGQKGLSKTLIEKGVERLDTVSLLKTQYRMHRSIMGFSNQQFYANELVADSSVADHELAASTYTPVEFVDTAGCGFDEVRDPESLSLSNPEEAGILRKHLEELVAGNETASFGIISPYRDQVKALKAGIEGAFDALDLTIQTIDSFQGQERDVIYISMVRSNTDGEVGFLKDYRRMNVAMTRARKKLIVLGDSATLGANKFYQDFLEYCEKHGSYRSAWEYMT